LLSIVMIGLLGLSPGFIVALLLLTAWSFVSAVTRPMRQAYLNGVIPSEQRATVLSFDSLMGSAGGVVAQPALGRVADQSGYAASYLVSAGIQVVTLPFVLLARRTNSPSDPID
jgi:predicted MFS family arabinose efflux permease